MAYWYYIDYDISDKSKPDCDSIRAAFWRIINNIFPNQEQIGDATQLIARSSEDYKELRKK